MATVVGAERLGKKMCLFRSYSDMSELMLYYVSGPSLANHREIIHAWWYR
jgi:hypothetical protein